MPQRNGPPQQKVEAHQQTRDERCVTSYDQMDREGKVWPVTPKRSNCSESNSGTVSSSTDSVQRCAEPSSETAPHQRDTKTTSRLEQRRQDYSRSSSVHSDNGSVTSQSSTGSKNRGTRHQPSMGKHNGDNARFRPRDNRRYSMSNMRNRQTDGWHPGQARHYDSNRYNGEMPRWEHQQESTNSYRGQKFRHQEWHGPSRRGMNSHGSVVTVQNRANEKTGPPLWYQRERINGVADYEPCENERNMRHETDYVQNAGYERWQSYEGAELRRNRQAQSSRMGVGSWNQTQNRSRYDKHVTTERLQDQQSNTMSMSSLRRDTSRIDNSAIYLNHINTGMNNISIDKNRGASSNFYNERNRQTNGERLRNVFANPNASVLSQDLNCGQTWIDKHNKIESKHQYATTNQSSSFTMGLQRLHNIQMITPVPELSVDSILQNNAANEPNVTNYISSDYDSCLLRKYTTESSNKKGKENVCPKDIQSQNELHNGLMFELNKEMAVAERLNIPLRWDKSILNPTANEFRPVCSNESQNSDNKNPNSKGVIQIRHSQSRSADLSYSAESLDSTQSAALNNKYHANLMQSSLSRESENNKPFTIFNNIAQTNGGLSIPSQIPTHTNSSAIFLPVSTNAQEAQQTFGSFTNATNYTQPQVTGYQAMPIYCSASYQEVVQAPSMSYVQTPSPAPSVSYVHTPAPAPSVSYVQTSAAQELHPSVVPLTCGPGQFGTTQTYQVRDQPGSNQELTPIVLGTTSGTPLPLIATPITPVGIYNDGHFTYQVASVPTPPVVTCQELNLRPTQTEPRLFAPTQQSSFYQPPPPVLNFQTYCMAVDNDSPFIYPQSTSRIEEIGSLHETSNRFQKIPTLMDRVGDTLKEVQQSLKTSKFRRNKNENNSWGEILEKIMKLPPNFREPNELDEYRHLKKLSEIISTYINDVKNESDESLSESAIFQEVLDLSWPVANMDLSKGSEVTNHFDMTEDSYSKWDKNRIDRINQSRASLQKAWYELAMAMSKKSCPEKTLKNSALIINDLPQCDQMSVDKPSSEYEYFENMSGVGVAFQPRLQGDIIYAHLLSQDAPISDNADPENGQNRRQSMGNVNVGTRISYFESNTKKDDLSNGQHRAKK